jgi:hypothetical protein
MAYQARLVLADQYHAFFLNMNQFYDVVSESIYFLLESDIIVRFLRNIAIFFDNIKKFCIKLCKKVINISLFLILFLISQSVSFYIRQVLFPLHEYFIFKSTSIRINVFILLTLSIIKELFGMILIDLNDYFI